MSSNLVRGTTNVVQSPENNAEYPHDLIEPFQKIVGQPSAELNLGAAILHKLVSHDENKQSEGQPSLSQSDVNDIGSSLLGESFEEAQALSGIFEKLRTRYVVRADGEKDSNLTGLLVRRLHGIHYDRKARRTVNGISKTSESKMLDFLMASEPADDKVDLTVVNSVLTKPVIGIVNTLRDYQQRQRLSVMDIKEHAQLIDGVDTGLDLSVLKIAVFKIIIGLHQEMDIPQLLYGPKKGKEHSEKLQAIADSEYGAHYVATELIDDLTFEEGSERYARLRNITDSYRISHKFKLTTGRKFKKQFEQLRLACFTYVDILETEDRLKEIKECHDSLELDRKHHLGIHGERLALEAIQKVEVTRKDILLTRDKLISDDPDNAERGKQIWELAFYAEDTVLNGLRGLMQAYRDTGIKLDTARKSRLTALLEPVVPKQHAQSLAEAKNKAIQPELDALIADFNQLDAEYRLTSKQLRKTDERIIDLAHFISQEVVDKSESILIDDLRHAVALMLGAIKSKTPDGTTPAQWIAVYKEDTRTLRKYKSLLDDLSKAKDSRLLRSMHLIDELVDSGVFEKGASLNNPAMSPIRDFLLAYQNMQHTETPSHESPEYGSSEQMKHELSELPIEIIGQAKMEEILVFPPGASSEDVLYEFTQHVEPADLIDVQWERIQKFVELRDHCIKQGLDVNFIRSKQASWQKLPFFILEVKLPILDKSTVISLVESPVHGNATYVFRERKDGIPWREAVQLSRDEARALGAVPKVHVDENNLEQHKKKLWDSIINEATAF
jgi:hypothetical protein